MTATTLSPVPRQLFLNPLTGSPYVGGLVYTYAAGTVSQLATYTDSTGTVANVNPIILDSLGEADIWLPSGVAYKFVFTNPTDTNPPTSPIWTRDNISVSSGGSGNPNVLSLADFGPLVYDGVTDNNTTITAGINAAIAVSGGCQLYIPGGPGALATSGRYNLQDHSGITLVGAGSRSGGDGSTWIKAIGTNTAPLFLLGMNTAGVEISGTSCSGMRIDANGICEYAYQLVNLYGATHNDLWITNALISALDMRNTNNVSPPANNIFNNLDLDVSYGSFANSASYTGTVTTTSYCLTMNDNDLGIVWDNSCAQNIFNNLRCNYLNGDAIRLGYTNSNVFMAANNDREGHTHFGRFLVLQDTEISAKQHGNNAAAFNYFYSFSAGAGGTYVLARYVNNALYPYSETPFGNVLELLGSAANSSSGPFIVTDSNSVSSPTMATVFTGPMPLVYRWANGSHYGFSAISPVSVSGNWFNPAPGLSLATSATIALLNQMQTSTSQTYPAHTFYKVQDSQDQLQLLDYVGNISSIYTRLEDGSLNVVPSQGVPTIVRVLGTAPGIDGNVELTTDAIPGQLTQGQLVYVFGVGGTTEANSATAVNTQNNPTNGAAGYQSVNLSISTTQFTLSNTPYANAWTYGGFVITGNPIVLPVTAVSSGGSGRCRLTVPSTAFLKAGNAAAGGTVVTVSGVGGTSPYSADVFEATITSVVNSTQFDVGGTTYNSGAGYRSTGYVVVSSIVSPDLFLAPTATIGAANFGTCVGPYSGATPSNNGSGLIRITMSTPSQVNGLANGDYVTLSGFNGVPNATGYWPIANVNTGSGYFDLVGSIWAGTYTSGGTVSWVQPLTATAESETLVPPINAAMSNAGASATATFTADVVTVGTALNGTFYSLPSYSEAINLATTGAGGMDTGSAPSLGFVSLYAIYNPTTQTASILACNSSTSTSTIYAGANLPAGYTASFLLGTWPTNVASQFVVGYQRGKSFTMAPVVVLSGGVQTSLTSVSLSSAVPPNAIAVYGNVSGATSDPLYGYLASDTAPANELPFFVEGSSAVVIVQPFPKLILATPQTMYYRAPAGSGAPLTASISGYDIP